MGQQNSLNSQHEIKIFRQLQSEYNVLEEQRLPKDLLVEKMLLKYHYLHDLYLNRGSSSSFKCPTIRFGRTELLMPIISCGGMRMQETWSPKEGATLDSVSKECQDNFEKIVDRAIALGINHFETARGYGTSEIQYGPILKKYPRKDYILQTKVSPCKDSEEFRSKLLQSFESLQISMDDDNSFIDLFSFHGINKLEQLHFITDTNGCMSVVKEYQKMGKIRFIGFSTHAPTTVIVDAIETGLFDYVNLHYHFIGSYTSSGTGPRGGNIFAIEAARRHDMGVFIISPTDKGGGLYAPPKCFHQACLPLSPITFNNLFLWSQEGIHTIVVGAARPTDFDEHVEAALLYYRREEFVPVISERLNNLVANILGPEFMDSWFQGLGDAYTNSEGLPLGMLVWLWWIVKAWGFYHFALKRYSSLEANLKQWDDSKPLESNLQNFSWVPGLSYRPEREDKLIDFLRDHPRKEQIVAICKEVHQWLHTGGCIKRGEIDINFPLEKTEIVYDLQPDTPFPERE